MGSSQSAEKTKKIEDIKKILEKSDVSSDGKHNDTETIKSDDLKNTVVPTTTHQDNNEGSNKKEAKPVINDSDTIGSLNLDSDKKDSDKKEESTQKGGKNISKNRYNKYDVFTTIQKAEREFLVGGFNSDNETHEKTEEDNDKTMKHIKNIILDELNNLNHNILNQHGAGGCNCDKDDEKDKEETKEVKQEGGFYSSSSSDSSNFSTSSSSDSTEVVKKNSKHQNKSKHYPVISRSKTSKKSKKSKKHDSSDSESNLFEGNLVINNSDDNNTSNNSQTEEGLSIFPFNSSDVKSSVSDRHHKILKRKI
jgi:hypothetical protein